MLTKEQFQKKISQGIHILDGATGSNLRNSGMPKGCCTEQWVLENPEPLVSLQRAYAEAGSQIIYAPTFQAQPIALQTVGLDKQTEKINEALVSLSRSAAPGCLIAGDLTTLATFCDSWDEANFDVLVENYRRQIRGLINGGADLLVGETLLYQQEAEAILCAAELEGAGAQMYTFTMQPDGSLFSGADAGKALRELEQAGAAAVGFNCVAADMMLPYLVTKLRRYVKGPLICKPNAGVPTIGADGIAHYSQTPEEFAGFVRQCRENGATILGGCCGTAPDYIAALKEF
ncbi:MAG: homocysteine S-methyltransferase family protein [Oscillospiraceae bacterium]|nr:homocysteine S-methyltransferase family protein [Oscillospiraceae bacterium]